MFESVIGAVVCPYWYFRLLPKNGRTKTFFVSFFVIMIFWGLMQITEFFAQGVAGGDLLQIAIGGPLFFMGTLYVVFSEQIEGVFLTVFDKNQQIEDGAFAAELLDTVSTPTVGMDYYIQLKEPNLAVESYKSRQPYIYMYIIWHM